MDGKKNKHEAKKSKRRYCFAGFVLSLIFIDVMTYFLIPQNKEILVDVVKILAIFGGGFGTGFGVGKTRQRRK